MKAEEMRNEMKAKIFGLHIGCKVAMSDHNPEYTRMLSYRVIDGHEISIEEAMMWNKKLILTPLNEITDEDKLAIANIHLASFIDQDAYQKEDRLYLGQLLTTVGTLKPHIIDYLRSKSYALPYMGIDLFESSLAIPKQ